MYIGTPPALASLVGQTVQANSHIAAGTGYFAWLGRAVMRSPADGMITLLNNSEGSFSRLQFGGTDASKAALQVGSGGLQVVSADNSLWMPLNADKIGLRAGAFLELDTSNTIGQRNGVNAQAFRIYNAYTDASNHERMSFGWAANLFSIAMEGAGTGSTSRSLRLDVQATQIDVTSSGVQMRRNGSSITTLLDIASTGMTSTGLLFSRLSPAINQASGTYTVLDINPTETSIGAGPHYLVKGRIGAGGNVFGVRNTGAVETSAYLQTTTPTTVAAATYAPGNGDNYVVCNNAGTVTLTLPAAAAYPGRAITIKTVTANTVVSNASNVAPRAGGAVGTAILAAAAGNWALLVSDGSSWINMAGTP